jgi:hypothetical protein
MDALYPIRLLMAALDTGGVAQLAEQLDVPLETLMAWIAGTRQPSPQVYRKALEIARRGETH